MYLTRCKSRLELLKALEKDLMIQEQIKIVQTHSSEYQKIRNDQRDLISKKKSFEEQLMLANSEIEMEVYLEFPPRKGTDAQRNAMRQKLQKENETYQEINSKLTHVEEQMYDLDTKMNVLDKDYKSARRLLGVMSGYLTFAHDDIEENNDF